jgi:type IV fimbrial biogenesis protein FimT
METRSRGLTLLETMVVIGLAAILATIAVPSFLRFMTENRMASEMNSFETALMLARSEAIKRGQEVTLCTSSSGTGCSASSDWNAGWVIFSNPLNQSDVPDPTDIIRAHGSFPDTDTLVGSNTTLDHAVSFTGLGILVPGELTGGTFELETQSADSSLARCLAIGPGGQLAASEPGQPCPVE